MALVANNDVGQTSGAPVTVAVLANDTLDGVPVSLDQLAGLPVITEPPSAGSASVNADGSITYTPPAGFVGEVEIEYEISTDQQCTGATTGSLSEGSILHISNPPPWWGEIEIGELFAVLQEFGDWAVSFIKQSQSEATFVDVPYGEPPVGTAFDAVIVGRVESEDFYAHCCHFTYSPS